MPERCGRCGAKPIESMQPLVDCKCSHSPSLYLLENMLDIRVLELECMIDALLASGAAVDSHGTGGMLYSLQ